MVDIVSEVIRVIVLAMIFVGLVTVGRYRKALAQPGWYFLLGGFGLLLFGCVLDVTDNFESLNRYVVIGDTEVQSILEKLVGFLGGFILLAIGLLRWLPRLTSFSDLKETAAELEDANVRLKVAATTDKLTGLPNREVFLERLDQTLKRSRRDGRRFAVLFFDFDRFKVINDSLGHNVGDALLIDIAKLFEYSLPHDDIAARFGGDEFVVLLSDMRDYEEAIETANCLLKTFAKPHNLMGHLITSTASIGLLTSEQGYTSADDMIRDADAAMYQAKDTGKNRVVVFDKAMHAKAMDKLALESDMHNAIAEEQFRLVYQPIVELGTGKVSGLEALIRWDHPKRGTVEPNEFIGIAEETGQIIDIGKWVLRTAARQSAEWNQRLRLDQRLSINVNISKRQLLSGSLLDDALECQRSHKLQPGDLQLEITESIIVDDRSDITSVLCELREQGFPIVLDDFGTGVSSLSTLHEYPIDVLKIDQSFIRVLDSDRSLLAVVASITSLAENLGIKTVAEGIETADVVGALQSIDCTWAQGYYFAKPLTVAGAEAYVLGVNENKRSA
jgi:diguanylate cyclase (GGDEF)-like protein